MNESHLSLSLSLFCSPGRHVSVSSTNSAHGGGGGGGHPSYSRRQSDDSILSGVIDAQQLHTINILKPKWWGSRRIDYALYCPEGLANFPTNSLPHLFHSSYWESADVISFILRQLVRGDSCNNFGGLGGMGLGGAGGCLSVVNPELNVFTPNQPREKWIKKRTSVKIRYKNSPPLFKLVSFIRTL